MTVPGSTTAPRHDALGAAHVRFGRAVVATYLGTAAISLLMLVAALAEDRAHEEQSARDNLLLQTEVRAQFLARHLGLIAGELRRLGLRSEVDLLDQNMEPERGLLRVAQERSAFFNVGIAIVSVDGIVAWAQPQDFLPAGTSLAHEAWFQAVRHQRGVRIVTVEPEREKDSLLYVVSPVVRNGQFTGALLGGIDLASGDAFEAAGAPGTGPRTLIATHEGAVVYPPKRPDELEEAPWREVMDRTSWEAFQESAPLFGHPAELAAAPVSGADLVLMSVADQEELFGPARTRLESRLATGLAIAAVPLALLVLLLRRSLRIFRRAEREAVHEEELRRLGEASNLIAHEVKNALNGIRLGVDLAVAGDPARPRHSDAVIALRQEIGRLAEFTGDLLNVAKGIAPRPVPMDLADLVRKVADLQGGMAADLGVDLGVVAPVPVAVRADPSLVHSIIANLVGNALDALAGTAASHRSVRIDVRTASGLAVVDVTDDGPGVALAVKARLFEPFVTGKPSGTGIGLALSRKIARAHGGDLVLVEGSPKTCFRLTLPVGGEGTAR